jgi:hypothetical protein
MGTLPYATVAQLTVATKSERIRTKGIDLGDKSIRNQKAHGVASENRISLA